ncbi:MAG TPA: STAS domain-containing protein [Nevskiaceae bacterium]|nr:STAS domain-containing protein [Nevskiaceae bacterium]
MSATLRPEGQLGVEAALRLRTEGYARLAEGQPLRVDLAAVTGVHSAVVAVWVELADAAFQRGLRLELQAPPASVRRLLAMLRLERLLLADEALA